MVQPKSLLAIATTLAILAAASFVLGSALLAGGMLLPSTGGGSVLPKLSLGGDGPEDPGWEDGHPVGFYFMTRYWIATRSLEKASYYFTTDGRVYVDPAEGFSDEALAAHQGDHGTVRVEGDEMVITWAGGKEQRGTLERKEDGFNWAMGLFTPVQPFESAEPLAGRWEGGASVSFSGSSAITSRTLELHEDGTFTGAAAASLRSESEDSIASAGSHGEHSGTWKLDGYSLVLEYRDGRTTRGIAFPFDDKETPVFPDRFYFAGTMYRKL